MTPLLKAETEKLARSWQQHEPGWLRDYLVSGVEDPRVNLQSILTRHFLIQAATDDPPQHLLEEECRFSAAMNWLLELARKSAGSEDLDAVLFALEHGADNAEGIELPRWLTHAYASLPLRRESPEVPNYIRDFLTHTRFQDAKPVPHQETLNTFCRLWREKLARDSAGPDADPSRSARLSVVEPACGSANDYRFFEAFGLASRLDYTGFDLCAANIENAKALFPGVRFLTGNVFEIPAEDKSFECCVVHDLFEHLSLEGMEAAVAEICRVTRAGICANYFQMDEIPAHRVRPVEEYHWNLMSLAQTQALFAAHGFAAQVFHIGTFLRAQTGCDQFHNPNAYTLWLRAQSAEAEIDRASSLENHT